MILFIAVLLLAGTTAQATDQKLSHHKDGVTKRYHHTQPIIFIEGGVKFFVYPDGGIDYKVIKRRYKPRYGHWNSNAYNAPGAYRHHRPNNFIKYDYHGRLKKVGRNYITYDRYNRVRRVGTVSMRYNRRGLVYQIGGLHIYYKKYGRIKFVEGSVHYNGCGYCGIDGCSITHGSYYKHNWKQKQYDHDDDDDDHNYKDRRRRKKHNDDDDD